MSKPIRGLTIYRHTPQLAQNQPILSRPTDLVEIGIGPRSAACPELSAFVRARKDFSTTFRCRGRIWPGLAGFRAVVDPAGRVWPGFGQWSSIPLAGFGLVWQGIGQWLAGNGLIWQGFGQWSSPFFSSRSSWSVIARDFFIFSSRPPFQPSCSFVLFFTALSTRHHSAMGFDAAADQKFHPRFVEDSAACRLLLFSLLTHHPSPVTHHPSAVARES